MNYLTENEVVAIMILAVGFFIICCVTIGAILWYSKHNRTDEFFITEEIPIKTYTNDLLDFKNWDTKYDKRPKTNFDEVDKSTNNLPDCIMDKWTHNEKTDY